MLQDSTLPSATIALVEIRASQINGCGACTDLHTKEAARAGETSTRLNLIPTWREATVFSDAELAALELTEREAARREVVGLHPCRATREGL